MLPFIYQQWLDNCESGNFLKKVYGAFFKGLRRVILVLADPLCKLKVRGQMLWMPYSHLLPLYARQGTQYDMLLPRIADFIRTSRGHVCGIDVGANIGDTILMCIPKSADQFLAIEPNPIFFACLRRNVDKQPNVRLLQLICGDKDTSADFHITTSRGTAQIRQGEHGETALAAVRLDTLLQTNVDFRDCNFLKIDTDGHDFNVIRGAKELIERAKPAVLFECDIFDNPRFTEDIEEIFGLFSKAGYKMALIYDNVGYLVCRLDPKQPATFAFALFHKLITQTYYFDVLMLHDAGAFFDMELNYFANLARGTVCQTAAKMAVASIKSGSGHFPSAGSP